MTIEVDGFYMGDTDGHCTFGYKDELTGTAKQAFWRCPPERMSEIKLAERLLPTVRLVLDGERVVDVAVVP